MKSDKERTNEAQKAMDLPRLPIWPYVFTERFLVAFDWKEFACGFGAASVNIFITYPITKMINRQMIEGIRIGTALKELQFEGLKYLYRGMLPPLAQKAITLSIMFGVYGGTRRHLLEDWKMNAYVAKIVAGITSGTVESVLLPFERIQVLLTHSKFHGHFANTPLAFRYVFVNYGICEFYKGLMPVLWRNGPSNALFFVMREEALIHLPLSPSKSKRMVQEFVTGALIGASISTFFYPLNVIKVKMQKEMGIKSQSMWATFKEIYHERGSRIRYFYAGALLNSCRSFLFWGILNSAYEVFRNLLTPKPVNALETSVDRRSIRPKDLMNVFFSE